MNYILKISKNKKAIFIILIVLLVVISCFIWYKELRTNKEVPKKATYVFNIMKREWKTISKEQVYIYLNKKYALDLNTNVYVEDIAKVYCKDQSIKKKVEKVRIYNGKNSEQYDYITANDITTKVLDSVDNIDITIIGGPDVLLEIKDREIPKTILDIIKTFFVCIILFFGSGLAIINFFEDVPMDETIKKIYFVITGIQKESSPLIATIPFSIGIGLGVFAFFNRAFSFSKRRKQEPGPLEIELYVYDKDMEEALLQELKNKD